MIKIIFCAFNEERNLQKLLVDINHELQILNCDYEIIACLDGSNDSSLQIISDFQKSHTIKILPIKNQRGLGIAYKRIFLDLVNNSADDDLIISLDADNTHNPEQIAAMLDHFKQNSLDVLIASRFCDSSIMDHFPLYRKMISKSISIFFQNLFPITKVGGDKLQDYTSGYRIYRSSKIKELFKIEKEDFITEPEFTYTCEFLIKLSRIKCRIDEIAISYDYGQKIGKSKLRIGRNFFRLMILTTNLLFK